MEMLGMDWLFWSLIGIAMGSGSAAVWRFWQAAEMAHAAFIMQGILLSRSEQELAACQFVRDEWQKVANERAAEIIRLMALIEDKEAI